MFGDPGAFSLNTLVLGVSLTASTSPEEGHTGNQKIFGPSGATTGRFISPANDFANDFRISNAKSFAPSRCPRKLIFGCMKSGGLLCLQSLPGLSYLLCLLRLLYLLRFLSIFGSFVCCDCCAYCLLCLLCLLCLQSLLS